MKSTPARSPRLYKSKLNKQKQFNLRIMKSHTAMFVDGDLYTICRANSVE